MNETKIVFQSKRLSFRNYKNSDFVEFSSLMQNPKLRRFTSGVLSEKQTLDLFQKILAGQKIRWAVSLKFSTTSYLEHVGLSFEVSDETPDVAYIIKQSFQKQGYATECLSALEDYATKNLKYTKLYARVYAENLGSIRVLQKRSFEKVKSSKDHKGKFFIFEKTAFAI